MRVIAKSTLRDFWEIHRDAEQTLRTWYADVEAATWRTPMEIKAQFGNASVVGDNRVVFNIRGNKYRVVVRFNYAWQVAYIRFVGTHEQYNLINVEVV